MEKTWNGFTRGEIGSKGSDIQKCMELLGKSGGASRSGGREE